MTDKTDFSDWYESSYGKVLGATTLACRDRELAMEATQEAFVRAYERWDRVAAASSPTAWVCRVALNVVKRSQRRAALERRLLRRVGVECPASDLLPIEVWEAVTALPPRQRTAVALRYLADLREVDVAEAMGIAPGTVARFLHDARAALGVALSEAPERPDRDFSANQHSQDAASSKEITHG